MFDNGDGGELDVNTSLCKKFCTDRSGQFRF